MEKGKRGELTSGFIITTILIIAGFVVVLYFILNALDLGGETAEEVCAFSVLTRATSPQTTSAYIPLKCTTKKICLSDGGECADFKGEENVKKVVKLSGDITGDKGIIEKTLADEMYNCWNMMGEGKMDLFNGGIWKTLGGDAQGVTCMICSRIKINSKNNEKLLKYEKDETGDNKVNQNKVNVPAYMETNQIDGKSETYAQYFAKDRSVNGYGSVSSTTNLGKISTEIKNGENIIEGEDLSEYAVVFTQIKTQGYMDTLNTLTSAGISMVVTSSQVPFVGTAVKSGYGIGLIGVTGAGAGIIAMANVYEGKVAAVNHCVEFQNEEESKKEGCSTVQILPYKAGSINNLCSYIEGDP